MPASSNISIRLVDHGSRVSSALLHAMDEVCFPVDSRCELDGGVWWIARDASSRAVAYAGLKPSFQFDKCGYLCRVGVLPIARGRGLQKKLLRVRESWARRAGWRFMVTDCTADNYASANSLIAAGYKLYHPSSPWAFKTSLYWYKDLEKKR